MFIMTMADTFQIGDRWEVRINGDPATVTWRDAHTLVINDRDARRILMIDHGLDGAGRSVLTFTCGDGDPLEARTPYVISSDGTAITCPRCGRTSHNPNDVRERYCGFCHAFHEDAPTP
jgi:hypothetical protein